MLNNSGQWARIIFEQRIIEEASLCFKIKRATRYRDYGQLVLWRRKYQILTKPTRTFYAYDVFKQIHIFNEINQSEGSLQALNKVF
ncbi:MAG: hypothetical protein BBJ57_00290 [Desulfobacterales bacterium PC51MH44]|nr:MAG: hypothetical protein BBJ57_00290 [Desulfobacterales bacterium PC51MH44]